MCGTEIIQRREVGGQLFPLHRDATLIEDIGQYYDVAEKLGEGKVGVVYAAVERATLEKHALKVVDKRHIGEAITVAFMLSEIKVLSMIDHPNVVRCSEVYESKDELIIALELLEGAELFDAIQAELDGFTELRAASIIRDILRAVEYLHSIHCTHRDISPSNIVFADTRHTVAKLSDFGFATVIEDGRLLTESCGTVHFMAPEIIQTAVRWRDGYGLECDMWSVACVLYCLLVAYEPFYQEPPEVYNKITSAQYDFPAEDWTVISHEAKDLISKLLVVSPQERLTGTQALAHPWIANLSQQPVEACPKMSWKKLKKGLASTVRATRLAQLQKRILERRASINPMVMHNGVNIMDDAMIAELQEGMTQCSSDCSETEYDSGLCDSPCSHVQDVPVRHLQEVCTLDMEE